MRALILAATVGILCATATALEPPKGFLTSCDKALEQARKENKLVFLHFTTDWCGWCRKLDEAIATEEKALALDPKSAQAGTIKGLIEGINRSKTAARTTRPAAVV